MRQFCKSSLLLDERKQSHQSSALYREIDCALLFASEVDAALRLDAAVGVDELLEEVDVLVVDVLNVILGQDVIHMLCKISVRTL